MSESDVLLEEQTGAVLWLTMNRPDRLNTLNVALVTALRERFEALEHDTATRVVVLKGNGRAFCAGLELDSDTFGSEATVHNIYGIQKSIAQIYRAMRRCPQPIISLVQGPACGGGFSLALASDIRIAGESAKMNAAYIKAGLTACDMGCSYFLPRLVGLSIASELMMTGRFIHADRALRVNLVSEVVADEQLAAAAQPYIDEMLTTSPMGLRLTKDGLNQNIDAQSLEAAMAIEDRQQALLALTRDAGEAIAAFMEKRAPVYRDQ